MERQEIESSICCFTSATVSYLPNARILARSFKENHPDIPICLLLNDVENEKIDWNSEPFDFIIHAHHLPIESFPRFAFKYSVVEFCTATKGVAAKVLQEIYGYQFVLYLDPDTMVFSRLEEVFEHLRFHDTLLTPHVTGPDDTDRGIEHHEIAALKHGTFNLGFFAVSSRDAGREFLEWWADRLIRYSKIDFDRGLFTDQKWANLVPYMFKNVHVMCDRNYNVATWNIADRRVRQERDGEWLVNDQPLRFYHFSGFGNDFYWANKELAEFASDSKDLQHLWSQYRAMMEEEQTHETKQDWYWGRFDNGVSITESDRNLYFGNSKLMAAFPNPRCVKCFMVLRDLKMESAA